MSKAQVKLVNLISCINKPGYKYEDLLCVSCQDLAQGPQRCIICYSVYCQDCADRIKNKRKKCFNCNGIGGKNLNLEQDENLMQIIENSLKFNCKGCDYSTNDINKISYHLLDCSSSLKTCPNEPCDFQGSEEEVTSHCGDCKFFCHICDQCGYKIKSMDERDRHNCLNKIVEWTARLEESLISEKIRLCSYIEEKKASLHSLAEKYDIFIEHCPKCRNYLKWLTYDEVVQLQNTFMCQKISACNLNYRFLCSVCNICFCTNCVKFKLRKNCYCGRQMIIMELFERMCDFCEKNIDNDGWTCSHCKMDLCYECCPISN
jgi:hypothetical protein